MVSGTAPERRRSGSLHQRIKGTGPDVVRGTAPEVASVTAPTVIKSITPNKSRAPRRIKYKSPALAELAGWLADWQIIEILSNIMLPRLIPVKPVHV